MANPFDQLVQELARLPGVGRRSAERAALALARKGDAAINPLMEALASVRDGVVACARCGAITTRDANPCPLCVDPSRDDSQLLVVEGAGDILALERSGAYRGRYHSLGGRISPAQGLGPADTTLAALEKRLSEGAVKEVILALATDVEGDATAAFLRERLAPFGVRLTRLAFGLPADSGVRYSDPLTLRRALLWRQEPDGR